MSATIIWVYPHKFWLVWWVKSVNYKMKAADASTGNRVRLYTLCHGLFCTESHWSVMHSECHHRECFRPVSIVLLLRVNGTQWVWVYVQIVHRAGDAGADLQEV